MPILRNSLINVYKSGGHTEIGVCQLIIYTLSEEKNYWLKCSTRVCLNHKSLIVRPVWVMTIYFHPCTSYDFKENHSSTVIA